MDEGQQAAHLFQFADTKAATNGAEGQNRNLAPPQTSRFFADLQEAIELWVQRICNK